MITLIKEALAQAGIQIWSIEKKQEWDAELFFIRRRLDMHRMKQTCKYHVSVYCDFEKDGKPMRGVSQVTIVPSQTKAEILDAVRGAYYAASFVANPTYELPDRQVCEPIIQPGVLADIPVEQAAMKMAEAIFSADCDPNAFLNSVEIFAVKTTTHLLTCKGTDVCYTKFGVNGEFVAQCKEPEDVEMHHTFSYDDLSCEAVKKKAETALLQAAHRSVARHELPSGTYDLILSGDEVAEVLSYYLSRTHVGMVFPGYSTWKVGADVQPADTIGERLELTLRATAPYSSEGIPMANRVVIKNGKVVAYHGGARLSSYLGVPPTGDYRAFSCENGTVSLADMKKGPYLYPVSFSDFQMDEMSGHFGGEIRLAYYFDGKETHIVTGGSVNGSINDCCGSMIFSKERYDSERYKGPFAMRLPGVRVAGTVPSAE